MFEKLYIYIYALHICIYGDRCPCIQSTLHIYIYIYIYIYICSMRPNNTVRKPLMLQEAAVSMA